MAQADFLVTPHWTPELPFRFLACAFFRFYGATGKADQQCGSVAWTLRANARWAA